MTASPETFTYVREIFMSLCSGPHKYEGVMLRDVLSCHDQGSLAQINVGGAPLLPVIEGKCGLFFNGDKVYSAHSWGGTRNACIKRTNGGYFIVPPSVLSPATPVE
jgi:hypothetical protein